MAFQHKDNTGSLFRNDKREKESQPHAKGSALIGGIEYWISAWTNEGSRGKYQSLKFEPKEKREETKPPEKPAPPKAGKFDDDDIPF